MELLGDEDGDLLPDTQAVTECEVETVAEPLADGDAEGLFDAEGLREPAEPPHM